MNKARGAGVRKRREGMRLACLRKAALVAMLLAELGLAFPAQGEDWKLRALWDPENEPLFQANWRRVDFHVDPERDDLRPVHNATTSAKRELRRTFPDPDWASDQGAGAWNWGQRDSLAACFVTFGTVLADISRDEPWWEPAACLAQWHERVMPRTDDWAEICRWDRPRFDCAFESRTSVPGENFCWDNEQPVSVPEPGTNMLLSIASIAVVYLVWRRRQSGQAGAALNSTP